jgi:hypothetical protein
MSLQDAWRQIDDSAVELGRVASELSDRIVAVEKRLQQLPGKIPVSAGGLAFRRSKSAEWCLYLEQSTDWIQVATAPIELKVVALTLLPKLIMALAAAQRDQIQRMNKALADCAELFQDDDIEAGSKWPSPTAISDAVNRPEVAEWFAGLVSDLESLARAMEQMQSSEPPLPPEHKAELQRSLGDIAAQAVAKMKSSIPNQDFEGFFKALTRGIEIAEEALQAGKKSHLMRANSLAHFGDQSVRHRHSKCAEEYGQLHEQAMEIKRELALKLRALPSLPRSQKIDERSLAKPRKGREEKEGQ